MDITTYITNKNKFVAKDNDRDNPSVNCVFIEFLVGKNIDSNDSSKFTTEYEDFAYNLPKDGWYEYYKIEVPKTSNSTLWYDNGVLKEGNSVITDYSIIPDKISFTSYPYKSFSKVEFSVCNLQNCVVNLQRKAIFEGIKNCNIGACEKNSQVKQQRDFLFISLYVIEHLICRGKFSEAESILDGLSSCDSLCSDSSLKSNCNCNG